MKRTYAIGTALAAGLILASAMSAGAAEAPDAVGGTWLVKGKVSTFAFTLTCKFDHRGEALTGTCYDGGSNKPHALTAGSASNGKVQWTYKSSFMLKPFDVTYSGAMDGAEIKGKVIAPGYQGVFTATRP